MELESKENPRNLWKASDVEKYQVKAIHHIVNIKFVILVIL